MRPDELENCVLADPRLCSEVRALGELGFEGWHSVAPILEVRYRRRRFIDPVSGASVCVDTDIVVPRVNRAAVTGMVPGIIQNAVVELKGGLEEFPAIYSPLFRMGLRNCSFSKYLAGYARVMQLVYDPR